MKIGILQTGHVADELVAQNGDYPEIFASFLAGQGLEFENWAVCDNVFPDSAEAADGWLVTGSRFGAYEGHDWIPPLEALIHEIFDSGRPLVGVCFGHQIIAQAMGGRVEKFAEGWAVGRQDYQLGAETYALNAWHQDQVVEVPRDAQVVGSTAFCRNAALLYEGRAFTIQPHPEIDATYLGGLLEVRAPGVVPEALRQEALERLADPTDSHRLAEIIATFFKEKRLP